MEEKHYKSRAYRIILQLVYGAAATIVSWVIAYNFLAPMYAVLVAAVVALLYLWLVIIDCFIEIIVKDGKLIVVKGKKRKEFVIDECQIRAKATTSSGDTSCHLTMIDPRGREHGIDCELIGIRQFNSLLEDLGVVGEKAKPQVIRTQKRGE